MVLSSHWEFQPLRCSMLLLSKAFPPAGAKFTLILTFLVTTWSTPMTRFFITSKLGTPRLLGSWQMPNTIPLWCISLSNFSTAPTPLGHKETSPTHLHVAFWSRILRGSVFPSHTLQRHGRPLEANQGQWPLHQNRRSRLFPATMGLAPFHQFLLGRSLQVHVGTA